MKTLKIIIIITLSAFLMSCNPAKDSTLHIDLHELEPLYTSSSFPPEEVLAVFDNKVLLQCYDDSKSEYLLCDRKTQDVIEYDDKDSCIVSSASYVITNDACYTSKVITDSDGGEILRIIELTNDGQFNVLKQIKRTDDVSPFVYFCKYDKNHILLIHRIDLESYIDIFDCESKSFSRFFTAKSTDQNERFLEKVSVCNKTVYIMVFENGHYFLETYGENFDLLNRMQMDIPLLKQSALLQFHVVNDFLIFENWNSEQSLYKRNGNSIKEIKLDNKRIMTSSLSTVNTNKVDFLFLLEKDDSINEIETNDRLYAFVLKTEEIKHIETIDADRNPYIRFVMANEDGSIVLSTQKHREDPVVVSYVIKQNQLQDILHSS